MHTPPSRRLEVDQDEGAPSILLVEDNEDDVEMVKRTLGRSGTAARLRVLRDASDVIDVLRARDREDPRSDIVVVLDLLLPVLHGVDVIRSIRQDPALRDTPIVVLTGCSDIELLRRCMELGANMYLLKPLDVADVTNILLGVRRYWRQASNLPARRSWPAMQKV
jgi:CheY-like chemotaxis protein